MIGTTAAILGAAAIGAISSGLASHAQSKSTQQATDASLEAKREDIAAAQGMYNTNLGILDPFREQGLRAGQTLSDLLLGPSTPAAGAASYAPQPSVAPSSFIDSGGAPNTAMYAAGGGGGGYSSPAVRALMGSGDMAPNDLYYSPGMTGYSPVGDGNFGGGSYGGTMTAPTGSYGGQVPGMVTAPAPSGQSAWDTFRNSTNYQFRLGEGQKSLNQGYAANGSIQSGAAAKALLKYGQDYASNELGNYMNLLAGQQNVGLNAARAVAGVGGDLTTHTINATDSAATTAANAALVNGRNQAALYGDLGGTLGKAIGALGGSSYSYGAIPPGFGPHG